MDAVIGNERQLARTGAGVFGLGGPLSTDAGLGVLSGPHYRGLARRLVAETG